MSIWLPLYLPALVSLLLFQDRKHHQQEQNLNNLNNAPFLQTVKQRTTQKLLAYTLYFWDHEKSSRGERTQVEELTLLILLSCSPGNQQQQSAANHVWQFWVKLKRSSPRHSAAIILAYKISQVVPTTRQRKKKKRRKKKKERKEDSNIPAGLSQEKSQQNVCTELKRERTGQCKPLLFCIGKKKIGKPIKPEHRATMLQSTCRRTSLDQVPDPKLYTAFHIYLCFQAV